ncbi:hypothetical protein ABAC460_17190 [Asticcacaulis sp. AC460]|nr:hypothetical protein ABAC460_17190 [Asticcacaulis sp. AC460]
MRIAIRQILGLFDLPDVEGRFQGIRDPAHAAQIMEHASLTATVYWHIRYLKREKFPEFLKNALLPTSVPEEYAKAVFWTWASLRPLVLTKADGWGQGSVMYLRDFESLM